MSLPKQVSDFHESAVTLAGQIISEGDQHDPLLFIEGGRDGSVIFDLTQLFSTPKGKGHAAEVMSAIVASSGADFAAYIIEAWTAKVDPGDDPETLTEDRPGAQEVIMIQAEIREGGFWCWSHKIIRDDAGTRVLDPEAEPWHDPGDYHRFKLFPRNQTWTN